MAEQLPLTPAQKETARELPWYRAWLASSGREEWQVDPPVSEERGYVGYRCRRREHQTCKGRWGSAHCTCPCHQGDNHT